MFGEDTNTMEARAKKINSEVIVLGVIATCVVLTFVLMTAYAAKLRAINNEIEQQNSYLAAEIDSINNEITDETTLDKIEKSATRKYGMVYPNSSNYVRIKDEKPEGSSLADAIREEVYG